MSSRSILQANLGDSPQPVASPCVSICKMNPRSGWCEGCLRTIDEIAHWALLDEEEKRAVWAALPTRRAAVAARGESA